MKPCGQSSHSWGRSIKDTNSSCPHTLFYWGFLILGFCFFFFLHCHPLQHSKPLMRKSSTLARPDLSCSMATWHVEFKNSCCSFYSSQHLAAHVDWTVLLVRNTCVRTANIVQHIWQQFWMPKQNFPSISHFRQHLWRKLSVNKSKLLLHCFVPYLILHINQVRLSVVCSVWKRLPGAQFSEQATAFC